MNYNTTEILIEAIKPYINSYEVENLTDRKNKIDHIIIDKKHSFSFQVFENEIIVFYFTDHCHFEDYTSELDKEADNYIERAKDFLIKLLTKKIEFIETYKKKKLVSDKYYLINNGYNEFIGGTYHRLLPLTIPFIKKNDISTKSTVWWYSKSKSTFITKLPKSPDADAIEVIDVNEDCYIEIHQKHNAYTYTVMKTFYDKEYGIYYWGLVCPPAGLYPTKESAIEDAMRQT